MADYLQKAQQAAEKKLAENSGVASPTRPQDRPPAAPELRKRATTVARPLPAYQPFPVSDLPRPLAEFVGKAAAALGCDHAMVALPTIAVCGSLIGNTRTIRLKNSWREPCIFWACVVADSGTLKSPALDLALRPLHCLQKRLATEYTARMAQYVIQHEEWKNRKRCDAANAGQEPPKPIMPRVVCSDITIERLGELQEENPRGILCARDELAGWFGSFARYKSKGASDLPLWLEMHHAGALTIDRKTSEKKTLFIDRAAVSLCGTIQPGILANTVQGDFLDSGLVARLLLAMPPKVRKQWRDLDIDPSTADTYAQLLENLYCLDFGTNGNGERVPLAIDLDAESRQTWSDFYNAFSVEQAAADGERAAALAKLEGYAARFALLHHVAERVAAGLHDTVPVSVESVTAGISLARWFAGEAQRVYTIFGETEKRREKRRLVEWIMMRGGETTVKELQDNLRSRYPTADDARTTLDELVAMGLGEWERLESGSRGGRPSERFRLHARKTAPAKPDNPVTNSANGSVSRFCGFAVSRSKSGERCREPGEEG